MWFCCRTRTCIPSDGQESTEPFLESHEVKIYEIDKENQETKEVEQDRQKRTLHELSLQSVNESQKTHLFVYDGVFTLLLEEGKKLFLCKGTPDECGRNESLRKCKSRSCHVTCRVF